MLHRDISHKIFREAATPVPFSGTCFRSVSPKYATKDRFLSARGSYITGGRYNFVGTFEALYLACDTHTCNEEVTKELLRNSFEVAALLPRMMIGIRVSFTSVLDLTSSDVRNRLGVTRKSLVQPGWQEDQDLRGIKAWTQQLGEWARDSGFEAIRAPSAAWKTGSNLIVFPDLLRPGSQLLLINPDRLP